MSSLRTFALATLAVLTTSAAHASDSRYFGPDPSAPGWARMKPEAWAPNTATTAAELVAGVLKGVMETTEGRPDTKVHIWTTGDTFRAAAQTHGLADDSVRAQETVIAMAPANGGWKVTEVWQRWICARGPNTRDWTDKPCP